MGLKGNQNSYFSYLTGFWQRVDSFIEQPEINFKHQLVVELQTSTTGGYVTWSTYQNLNMLNMDNLRIPLIKVTMDDIWQDPSCQGKYGWY